jgi:hypothetical protein
VEGCGNNERSTLNSACSSTENAPEPRRGTGASALYCRSVAYAHTAPPTAINQSWPGQRQPTLSCRPRRALPCRTRGRQPQGRCGAVQAPSIKSGQRAATTRTWAGHVQVHHLGVAVVVQPPVRLQHVQQDLRARGGVWGRGTWTQRWSKVRAWGVGRGHSDGVGCGAWTQRWGGVWGVDTAMGWGVGRGHSDGV